MKANQLRSLIIAGIASVCMLAPVAANAQRRVIQREVIRYRTDRPFKDLIDRTERESNTFRSDYEHSYRGVKRGRNWKNNQYGFWGRNLTKDIQHMDEAFERLRHNIDRRDWDRRENRDEMNTIRNLSNQINRDFGAGFGNYRGNERNLDSEWRELKSDIDQLSREFSGRR